MASHRVSAPPIALSSDTSSTERKMPWIPRDIVLGVMDCMDLPQLIRMAHTCRDWRRLAYSHPTFCRIIDIYSVDRASLECMLTRLAATDVPIQRLSFMLPMDDPLIEFLILPTLAAHLHRIEHLLVKLHRSKADALFHVLRGAAPHMKRLEIMLTTDDMAMADHVLLPTDLLLGGAPPQLVQFSGGNILLPEQAMGIFANVVEVAWVAGFNPDNMLWLSPRQISAHFPRMQKLSLEGPGCLVANALDGDVLAAQLNTLYINLYGSACMALSYMQRPPSMIIVMPTDEVLSLVLPDVTFSPLACRIRACPEDELSANYQCFSVELTNLRHNVIRETTERFSHFHLKGVPPIFRNTSWCPHVTELTIEHRIWCTHGLIKRLPPLNSLSHLTLLVDGANLFRSRRIVEIICPSLESIKLTSLSPISLQRTSLVHFLRRGLKSVPLDRLSITFDETMIKLTP